MGRGAEEIIIYNNMKNKNPNTTFFISGLHCKSCKIIIEQKIRDTYRIHASVSMGDNTVTLEKTDPRVNEHSLNALFEAEGYTFSHSSLKKEKLDIFQLLFIVITAAVLINLFIFIGNATSVSSTVSATSPLFAYFIFGALASISSCAALVGGIILSLSRQWSRGGATSHISFHAGRLISFAILGGVLGLIGGAIRLTPFFTAFLIIAVSIFMIGLGFQMIGISAFQKFQISLPTSVMKKALGVRSSQNSLIPFFIGAFTFFLPCGFTLSTQSIALISGGALKGSLIMFSFALGTLPALAFISASSNTLFQNPKFSIAFSKIAGILVFFFAVTNISSQLNVLGFSSPSILGPSTNVVRQDTNNSSGLVPIVDGKQLLKMNASSRGYDPNYFKIKTGVPVRWEVTDTGTSGCTNAIISRSLFEGQIDLTPGKTTAKEFTPRQPGKYRFSCWMGMVTGTIEVVN
ncbi:hypothetical protein COT62_01250 [Candidatus Roizmanbacteria bacterium CG09_land_8_20_14_0_10_41_9]|uniref:Uncharacterized protein n=1 Tax=Candidatus Roizmanbacteria bacterium CG09_land_8_20_14_0_10_41_9 TaxID=1974850 RepID=A0A2H0WTB3_9BACT|nr:MAG: hypothetical protein COT62_01250 [Candidatus Roizmanbacteria bacterium CG09_land_8_20_14_0_10_41_9]